jgi:hypothetical protein
LERGVEGFDFEGDLFDFDVFLEDFGICFDDVVDCLWSLRILCFGEVWGVNKNTRVRADQSPSVIRHVRAFHIVRTTDGSATRPRLSQPNLS